MSAAEELRAAAALLRKNAEGTTSTEGGGWSGYHVENDGRAAIYGGPVSNGYRTGVVLEFRDYADCEECARPSAADLAWMFTVHPGVAEPLATWLEACAAEMDAWDHGVVEGSASRKVHPRSPLGIGLMRAREDWTAALAVARAINGGGS